MIKYTYNINDIELTERLTYQIHYPNHSKPHHCKTILKRPRQITY